MEDEGAPPDSPKSQKKGFKELAHQALYSRRVSEGSAANRHLSVGDIFMQELYRKADKKKIAKLRHIAAIKEVIDRKVSGTRVESNSAQANSRLLFLVAVVVVVSPFFPFCVVFFFFLYSILVA